MSGRVATTVKAVTVVCLAALVGYVAILGFQERPLASGQAEEKPQPIVSATSMAPVPATEPRFAVVGDSYTGGSDAGGYPPFGWPYLLLNAYQAAGTPAIADVSGRGGSGYVHRGNEGTIFGEEVPLVVKPDDRVVVFFGSMNDGEVPAGELAPAVDSAFDTAQRIAPNATLLVIGPVWPRPDPPAGILAVRDVLAQAATAHGGVFVDPIAEGWLWDRPDTIGADAIHPTNAGHEIMANLIGSRLAPLLRPTT